MKHSYRIFSSFIFSVAISSLTAQTTTFNYTGAVQTYTVPPCCTAITFDVSGAQGGGPAGGMGGRAQATIPVTAGQTLYIYVGGHPTAHSGAGGFNGGGAVNAQPCGGGTNDGYPGGGASDVRITTSLTDRIIVGGGGGGSGWTSGAGGTGGGANGSDGAASWIAGTQGFGATQSAGGAGGYYTGNSQSAGSGSLGLGGDAGPLNTYCIGGAGGGGYYGGGGGYVSAGAGGSSYISYPGSTSTSTTSGFRSGDGIVTITPVNGVTPPGAITGSNTVCAGSTGNYSIATVPGATSYTWTAPSGATINSGQGTTTVNVTMGSASGSFSVTATFPCGTSGPSTLSITVNPSPTVGVTVSPSAAICSGGNVTLSGTGATSYSWSGGITDGIPFTPSSTTTYTVTGTTAGCSGTATQTITVNPLPAVTANSTSAAVCNGSSVTLTGGGATSYTWTGGVTDGMAFTPSSTLTYTVTGTDANGCMNTATTTVTVNPIPTVTANSTASTVCSGSPVTLTGSGATSYTWTGGVTDGVAFNPTATNTYTVTGTDANGCGNTASATVTVNPLPSVFANTTSSAVCAGSSVTLTGSGASTYTWTGGVTDGVPFNPASTATYTVTGTDANSCMNTATVNITVNPAPSVFANSTSGSVCAGSSVTLTGSGALTYSWTGGVTNGVPFTPTVSLTYTVTGTDGNGCMNTATTTVIVNPLPTVTGNSSVSTACLSDAAVTLTGTPAGGTWSGTGVSGSTFSPSGAGVGAHTATYTFTDANGCTNTASATVTVNACTGIDEQLFQHSISLFPNPSNGVFTISSSAEIENLQIEITDMQGRVVYSSAEQNIPAGFTKEVNLEKEANGMYLVHFNTNNSHWTEKISIQR